MAATTNPMLETHPTFPSSISSKTFTIAGILTTVYGIDELPPSSTSVACLWLLHPRLQTQKCMAPVATQTIHAWNNIVRDGRAPRSPKGLIAVSFDQRNHGSREVDPLANEAWRQGNPRHAQDMFTVFNGTATDTSHLISYLPAYTHLNITSHIVLGVSLGAHAAWHLILSDPRITAATIVIGCPDYTRLMTDRARLSKLKTWTSTNPAGATFLGSEDYPPALLDAIAKYDAAGLLLPGYHEWNGTDLKPEEIQKFKKSVRERLAGKRILNLSGSVDKLVPYKAGEPFYKVFKNVIEQDSSIDVEFTDVIFDGVGHAFSPAMAETATKWICDVLAKDRDGANVAKI